jgi:RNA polymerase sigma factor (sigma-70 family)
MASGAGGAVLRQVDRLYGDGSVAGMSDGQLLERFLRERDEMAFEALVVRHGPLVLGVCRRILKQPSDVEDAFQATFLVMVKKMRSIRDRERLGPWLFGVAYRVAFRARAVALRRRTKECAGVEAMAEYSAPAVEVNDLRSVLDEEIRRLPATARCAVLVCDLEGHTCEEAARRLGWPLGTVKSRLSRARERLRLRLKSRGLAPSAAVLATALAAESSRGDLPSPLIHTTVKAASQFAAGRTAAAGAVSAAALSMAQGVLTSMFITKLIGVGAVALGGLLVAGATAMIHQKAIGESKPGGPRRQVTQLQVPALAANFQADDPRAENQSLPVETNANLESRRLFPSELFVKLAQAQRRLASAERMVGRGLVSNDEAANQRDTVAGLKEQIEELAADLSDEIELLEVQREMRKASLLEAEARIQEAEARIQNLRELHKRGEVATGQVAGLEENRFVLRAQREQKQWAVREVEVRIAQAKRRLARVREATKQANESAKEAQKAETPAGKQR